MTLRKKTILSFLLSATMIALLIGYEYVSFIHISKEIYSLEFSDSLRSMSLQLRRAEKNYFIDHLYDEEGGGKATALRATELEQALKGTNDQIANALIQNMLELVIRYEKEFIQVWRHANAIRERLQKGPSANAKFSPYHQIIEAILIESPHEAKKFLSDILDFEPDEFLYLRVRQLQDNISLLRKTGEKMVTLADQIDFQARINVENSIRRSRWIMAIMFILFIILGVGTLYRLMSDVTFRLRKLTEVVVEIGRGHPESLPHTIVAGGGDEVDQLIHSFTEMQTQLTQREHDLRVNNDELLRHRKLAAVGVLVSGVAHEINNPLNNIHLSIQTLARGIKSADSPYLNEITTDIQSQIFRIKLIVSDLLGFARDKPINRELVELFELVERAFMMVEQANPEKVQKVKFEIQPPEHGIRLNIDRNEIERCLINIFENAINFFLKEGVIKVSFIKKREEVMIKIADNGPGISPEDQQRIFEPFFSKSPRGTGLGLAIVFNIMEKHGGKVHVESCFEEGTNVFLHFPISDREDS